MSLSPASLKVGPIQRFCWTDVDYTDTNGLGITLAPEAVNTWFDQHDRYDLVINCAAATNVDGCGNFEIAFAVTHLKLYESCDLQYYTDSLFKYHWLLCLWWQSSLVQSKVLHPVLHVGAQIGRRDLRHGPEEGESSNVCSENCHMAFTAMLARALWRFICALGKVSKD